MNPDDVLRIGQVSKLYGISLDTLRYYDKIGLLKPTVDSQNHYRYYSFDQLDVLEWILAGKHLKTPLLQLKETIDSENLSTYISVLENQKEGIHQKRLILDKLEEYLLERLKLTQSIASFENDYTFSHFVQYPNLDLHIYRIHIDHLPENNPTAFDQFSLDSVDQWGLFNVHNGLLHLENNIIGFSFSKEHATILKELSLNVPQVDIVYLHGHYQSIRFWGTQIELSDYLAQLIGHVALMNTEIYVKYHYAMLRKNMQHDYFVEIFFQDAKVAPK